MANFAKRILHGSALRKALLQGIDTLADAVEATLGPRGRNVVIDNQFGSPEITKDGVTVAKSIWLPDADANVGVKAVRNVADATAEEAGDGTTTATVLARAIYKAGVQRVEAGANPMGLLRGINRAVNLAVAAVAAVAKPVDAADPSVKAVATISANGDAALGDTVAEAIGKVGRYGIVTLDDTETLETVLEMREGYQFDSGWVQPMFVTDPDRMECVLENPLILVSDLKLVGIDAIVHIMSIAATAGRGLLVVAPAIDGDALVTMVSNKQRGSIKCCAVQSPGGSEVRRKAMLEDLAVATGATVHTLLNGRELKSYGLEDLGQANRVIVAFDRTIILEAKGGKDRVAARVKEIRHQHDLTENAYDKEQLNQRAARLKGEAAVLKVGGKTDTERLERKARVEDAVCAARAAVEEGVVPGGGLTLYQASQIIRNLAAEPKDEAERDGMRILVDALEAPLRAIVKNAHGNAEAVLAKLQDPAVRTSIQVGYNAATGEFEDLASAGILDPAKVVRVALQNAASIAGLLLTTEYMVVPIPPEPSMNLQRPGYPQLPQ